MILSHALFKINWEIIFVPFISICYALGLYLHMTFIGLVMESYCLVSFYAG